MDAQRKISCLRLCCFLLFCSASSTQCNLSFSVSASLSSKEHFLLSFSFSASFFQFQRLSLLQFSVPFFSFLFQRLFLSISAVLPFFNPKRFSFQPIYFALFSPFFFVCACPETLLFFSFVRASPFFFLRLHQNPKGPAFLANF